MNYIAFSLFGDVPRYHVGARKNVLLAKQHYPGWYCVFFMDQPTSETARALDQLGAIVVDASEYKLGSLYWRHTVGQLYQAEVYLVRDCDSRINGREAAAVDEWLKSDKRFHVMRDHPKHVVSVMQGMYGCKCPGVIGMGDLLAKCPNERNGAVAAFDRLYQDVFQHSVLEHGSFNKDQFPQQVPFPLPMENHHFVGEQFDENGQRNDDWKELESAP